MSSTPTTQQPATPKRLSTPSRHEGIPRLASEFLGGPVGRFAVSGTRGWRLPAALLSACSSMLIALGVIQKNHCLTTGWVSPGSLWRACYSDLPLAVSTGAGSSPWSNPSTSTQPPLTAILTWLVRLLVPDGAQLRLQQGMFAWGAAVIALLIAAAVCFTASAWPNGPWAAAHIALSPVLITTALISFDALAVLLVAAGLWAWRRSSYPLSGALLAAVFLTRPALGVVFIACLAIALVRRNRTAVRGLVVGGVGATAVIIGLSYLLGGSPFEALTNWRDQGASYGAQMYLVSMAGTNFSSAVLTTIALVGWVAATGVAVLLARQPWLRPEHIALVMLIIVLITSKSVPVQAAMWVLPLIAMAGVKWRDHLIWAGAELVYFEFAWLYVARASNPPKALPGGWYAAATAARLLALIWLTYSAIRTVEDDEAAAPSTEFARSAGNQ